MKHHGNALATFILPPGAARRLPYLGVDPEHVVYTKGSFTHPRIRACAGILWTDLKGAFFIISSHLNWTELGSEPWPVQFRSDDMRWLTLLLCIQLAKNQSVPAYGHETGTFMSRLPAIVGTAVVLGGFICPVGMIRTLTCSAQSQVHTIGLC